MKSPEILHVRCRRLACGSACDKHVREARREDQVRGWWRAALVAGGSFCLATWCGWHGPAVVAWKGAGVAFLACAAACGARRLDDWLLVAVMALGSAGDVLLELAGMTTGAAAFLAGHLVAIVLYVRNPRRGVALRHRWLSWAVAPATMLLAVLLTPDGGAAGMIAIYAAALGMMAASALNSRFVVAGTGIGALLFVMSDLLIFARTGLLAGSVVPTLLVWPLYFAGQVLIARGAIAGRRGSPPPPVLDSRTARAIVAP